MALEIETHWLNLDGYDEQINDWNNKSNFKLVNQPTAWDGWLRYEQLKVCR